MARSVTANINPDLLLWARKSGGYDRVQAAQKLKISEAKLISWEDGSAPISIRQLEKLAKLYKRPLGVFFLPQPPNRFDRPFSALKISDFRRLPDITVGEFSPALIFELRKAEARREIAMDLLTQMNEAVPELTLRLSLEDNFIEAAKKAREFLGVTVAEQLKWRSSNIAFKSWCEAVEKQGILVFQTGIYQTRSVSLEEMRGVAISTSKLPIIIVNGRDTKSARTFTLLHEFCHLLLGISGVSDIDQYSWTTRGQYAETEVFCNRFAAELIVPMSDFRDQDIVTGHEAGTEWNDDQIRELASRFSVSEEVIVRRLLTAGLVTIKFYQQKRNEYKERFESKQEKKPKQKGSPPRDRMLEKFHGARYITTVIDAYHNDVIGLNDALDYLDAKNNAFLKLEQRLSS